ncbi:LacI family DNA-binding transcriptional regulator [Azospirillum sp. RWY-5-1]|uniref:LacI family DNA-binding transcriptional regulator n=1 Tax=Azospirillum oleiclasticum TaxID=2735135 RepID=A0ABX2T6E4_9PROT|nr:LacI family DNA-binding transcriptional regulator [Azospirillum oleiclasticum]NYZ12472.1 LacI family DNA-binding transcriptional regulator [Azospirillum oleiclasticum]NYZ19632.1 LacI family DNA-binding transcriptional regulator [Azospirillum oleiclasticum]
MAEHATGRQPTQEPAVPDSPATPGGAAERTRRGNGSVGIRDVARAAGVSTATVSRVLNTPEAVGQPIREKVLEAVRQLRYVPHSAARALSLQRSHTLGIVIPSIANSIFAAQVEALQKCASEHGYNVVIALSDFSMDNEFRQMQNLVANGAEGVMLVGGWHRPELYDLLNARGVVYVNTSVYDPASPHPTIGFDNAAAIGRATNYLLELGHTRIGVLSGQRAENDRATYRLKGIQDALRAAGLTLDDQLVQECRYGISDARQAFRELMSRRPAPTAIVCHNDVLAFGAVLEAQDMGLQVPADVSVVGFDDLEWASQIRPSLTTVRVRWDQMATLAGEHLIAQLTGAPVVHATKVDVDLVVRESTGRCREAAKRPARNGRK